MCSVSDSASEMRDESKRKPFHGRNTQSTHLVRIHTRWIPEPGHYRKDQGAALMSVFLVGFDTSLTVFLYFYIARNDVKYPRPSTLFVCGSVVPPDFEAKSVGGSGCTGRCFSWPDDSSYYSIQKRRFSSN